MSELTPAALATQGAIDLVLGREPAIRAANGDATVVLDEIYPLIAPLIPPRPMLGEIRSLTGTAVVHFTRLSGLLSRPKALEFDVTVAGRLTDPDVKMLTASAVGATLIKLMSATFLAPVRLFDSAAGRAQGGP